MPNLNVLPPQEPPQEPLVGAVCPACDRGVVDPFTRLCNRCGVAVPRINPNFPDYPPHAYPLAGPRHLEEESPLVNYVRTKADQ